MNDTSNGKTQKPKTLGFSSRVLRLAELGFIFVLLPLVLFFELIRIPKIPALVALTLFCVAILWLDKSFDNSSFLRWNLSNSYLTKILMRFIALGVILFFAVWFLMPEQFLIFPRTNPRLWLSIMIFYPLVSALPQELIYRSYFFHRFRVLIPGGFAMILASAFVFSFLHIIYDNYIAVLLTLGGGFMFSKTFADTNSLVVVSLEHALYGCDIFTSGMGSFFYEPF